MNDTYVESALYTLGHAAANRKMAGLTPQEAYDLLSAHSTVTAERDALRAELEQVKAERDTLRLGYEPLRAAADEFCDSNWTEMDRSGLKQLIMTLATAIRFAFEFGEVDQGGSTDTPADIAQISAALAHGDND